MKTPVLFLVFNRPGPTRRVMEAIRKAQPPRLYVAADGPRTSKEGEAALTAEVREIATSVDWPCEVHTLFRDRNLGCRTAPSEAIDWFFEHEEEGIILEDDCLPAESFFHFCEEMLSRYRHDDRIWQVSGTVFFPEAITNKEADYFFSRFGPIWGWATWRRAWRAHYNATLPDWEEMKFPENFSLAYPSPHEARAKLSLGQMLHENRLDAWDYQWGIIKTFNSALTVLPKHNLVVNLGFDQDATHTAERPWDAPTHAFEFSGPLVHPQFLLRDWKYDDHYAVSKFKQRKTLRSIIRKAAKNLLQLLGQS